MNEMLEVFRTASTLAEEAFEKAVEESGADPAISGLATAINARVELEADYAKALLGESTFVEVISLVAMLLLWIKKIAAGIPGITRPEWQGLLEEYDPGSPFRTPQEYAHRYHVIFLNLENLDYREDESEEEAEDE